MTVSGTLKLRAWGFLLAALGGFLIGLGPLLVWATQTLADQLSHDVYGIDHTLGKVVLALGVVIVIGSFAMRFRATLRGMVATAVIVIVAAIAALGITAYVAMDPTRVLFGVSKAQATFLGDQLSVTLGVGIYLPMIGAVFVVVGTILSLRWAKRRQVEAETERREPANEEPAPTDP